MMLLTTTALHKIPDMLGVEGDTVKNGPKAGQRAVNGWKNAGLPWTYKLDKTKMYFAK